ncbi:hypothetical protein ACFP1Z_28680 [Streptomyces gamaensis]|uniref:Uncharacterized protein n=1 Tax=Streptomyces gamaensis TaxID=1763542 RepID=A0ABW0ZAL0_9ACTN
MISLVVIAVVLVTVMVTAVLLVRSARADATAAQQRADQALAERRTAEEAHQKALAERGRAAVGGTIDFLVFDGLFEVRQGARDPEGLTLVLADVKYGSSALTREQRSWTPPWCCRLERRRPCA